MIQKGSPMNRYKVLSPLLFLTLCLAALFGCTPADNASASTPPDDVRILPITGDFDHDAKQDSLEIITVRDNDALDGGVAWFELRVKNAAGDTLWTGTASPYHAGYNSYFACRLDGRDYLLQYNPSMYQGGCGYSYKLFCVGTDSEEITVRSSGVSFDINWAASYHSFDGAALADFMEEVNELLSHSTLLLSTDSALDDIDPNAPQDTLWWLTADSSRHPGYTYDASKTLRENLMALEETMHKRN